MAFWNKKVKICRNYFAGEDCKHKRGSTCICDAPDDAVCRQYKILRPSKTELEILNNQSEIKYMLNNNAQRVKEISQAVASTFTQESETNLHTCTEIDETKYCDGCGKRCKFEVHFNYLHTPAMFYPVIDGKKIKQYKNQDGEIVAIGKYVPDGRDVGVPNAYEQGLELAREIAKLCDHYKTR